MLVCPCGTHLSYAECCQNYHLGTSIAPTPEKLMRSRYSAYVFLLEPYLISTWHVSTRPVALNLISENLTHPRQWLGLTVLHAEQPAPQQGIVEFIAKYKIGGKAYKLHEISHFIQEDHQWFYVNGTFPKP